MPAFSHTAHHTKGSNRNWLQNRLPGKYIRPVCCSQTWRYLRRQALCFEYLLISVNLPRTVFHCFAVASVCMQCMILLLKGYDATLRLQLWLRVKIYEKIWNIACLWAPANGSVSPARTDSRIGRHLWPPQFSSPSANSCCGVVELILVAHISSNKIGCLLFVRIPDPSSKTYSLDLPPSSPATWSHGDILLAPSYSHGLWDENSGSSTWKSSHAHSHRSVRRRSGNCIHCTRHGQNSLCRNRPETRWG